MAAGRGSGSADEEERGAGSLRLCAATRTERAPEELIRFVAAPDGSIVADLSRRLPGRGVWVTADKAAVAAAVKSKAFARSLKRPVDVPEDLPQRVEALLVKRAIEALALANKAGLVTLGFAQVEGLIAKGEAAALVHGSDAAAGGREKLDRKLDAVARSLGRSTAIIDALSIEQMSLAMGRLNVVHAALKAGGASERFLNEAGRLARYRLGFGTSSRL